MNTLAAGGMISRLELEKKMHLLEIKKLQKKLRAIDPKHDLAPSWAKYKTRNVNGRVCWWETKPVARVHKNGQGYWDNAGGGRFEWFQLEGWEEMIEEIE